MTIAIHQPHFFPWLGYLDKMNSVDKFVLLNEVQLTASSPMYRCKILNNIGGEKYLTIPYHKNISHLDPFYKYEINYLITWKKNHLDTIYNYYKSSKYFNEVFKFINSIYETNHITLFDLIFSTINNLKLLFNLNCQIILQSDISEIEFCKKNDLLINICRKLNADTYLSGNGAKKYIIENIFKENNISLLYQNYNIKEYNHLNSVKFIPGLCILDVLFSIGIKNTHNLIHDKF